MIGKVTFDRHTHLVSAGMEYSEFVSILSRVFKMDCSTCSVSLKANEQGLCLKIKGDQDLGMFFKIQEGSDEIFELEVKEECKELVDSDEDEFYLLDANEKKGELEKGVSNQSEEGQKDSLAKLVEEQVDRRITQMQAQYSSKFEQMFRQYQSLSNTRVKRQVEAAITATIQKLSNPTSLTPSQPLQANQSSNHFEQVAPFSDNIKSEIIPILEQSNENDEEEELMDCLNLLTDSNPEEDKDLTLRHLYICCKICYRSLVHKEFYQCKICPKTYYCHHCNLTKACYHQLEIVSYSQISKGKTVRIKPPTIPLPNLPQTPEHLPSTLTAQQRILYLTKQLHDKFQDLTYLSVLKFVRKNETLNSSELLWKLEREWKVKPRHRRCM